MAKDRNGAAKVKHENVTVFGFETAKVSLFLSRPEEIVCSAVSCVMYRYRRSRTGGSDTGTGYRSFRIQNPSNTNDHGDNQEK